MKNLKPVSFMKRDRAVLFSRKSRAKFVEWDVTVIQGVVCLELNKPKAKPFAVVLDPDDVMDLRVHLGYAYDFVNGI
jgi:hypothetical protein